MPQTATPLETIQALYAAFGSGNVATFLAGLAEDVSWTFRGAPGLPYTATVHGRDGVQRWLGDVAACDDIQAFEPRRFHAGASHVTVEGWERTVARRTGRTFECEWVHVFELEGGRVKRFYGLYDSATAAAANAPG